MASFCSKCGSPLSANSAFCVHCGTPSGNYAGGAPNPAAAPPLVPQYAAPTPQGSSALKIIIVLLCVLVVGGIAVVGGVFYLAHRAKQIIVQKAAEQGVDLNSISSAASNTSDRRKLPNPCDVLSKADISRLIGEPIERAEVKDEMCLYYGPAGLSAKLAQDQANGTFRRAQAPGSTVGGTEVANSVDQLVNSLGAQTGQTGTGGELPLLMLGLSADGKSQMTAVSATKAIFGNLGKAADAKGVDFGSDIPGLGDKAVRVPKLGLNVLQGETLIRIIPGPFPDADAKTIAIARAVLPKI